MSYFRANGEVTETHLTLTLPVMRAIKNDKSVTENMALLGDFINPHLNSLKSDDQKKRIELCHVGKFLMLLDQNVQIDSLSESPDFILSNGKTKLGLEHQVLIDSSSKEKEGFFQNIFFKAEIEIKKDTELPNFLANCYVKPYTKFQIKHKNKLINIVTRVVKEFVLNDILIENPIIDRISAMPHSSINITCNLGAWWQKSATKDLIISSIEKKEKLINKYKSNGLEIQWLLIVIGGVGESSYTLENQLDFELNSEFDKIFLLEDFYNNMYELK